ncbi:MAG TPA: HPP family protein [Thermomicrobiales bacterium]|nr:HPP family protein [Thermomicrobiales bacterium]
MDPDRVTERDQHERPPRGGRYVIDRRHPIGGEMSDVVLGLLRRFQLAELIRYNNSTVVLALFSLLNGCFSIGLMSVVALVTRAPFIFPSLGPTAFLLFYTPTAPAASPRNTIVGHLIGALAGWLSLAAFGLLSAPPALASGVQWPRVGAAALSLGVTSGLMVLLRVPHPPAGATTLIISLGLMPHLWQVGVLMIAVILLTCQGFAINRLAGIAYPIWAPSKGGEPAPTGRPAPGGDVARRDRPRL